jgi:hypothetical protein
MKSTLIVIIFLTSLFSSAQIHKGTNYFNGNFSGNFTNNDNNTEYTSNYSNKYSSWDLNLSYGRYIGDNLAIGIGAGLSMSDNKYSSTDIGNYYQTTTKSGLYYVAPFIRASKSISEKLYCFGELHAKLGTGPQKITVSSSFSSSDSDGRVILFGGGIKGGLNYFLNEHFALALYYGDISYQYETIESDNNTVLKSKSTADRFYFNFGLSSVGFGLHYFVNCSKDKK